MSGLYDQQTASVGENDAEELSINEVIRWYFSPYLSTLFTAPMFLSMVLMGVLIGVELLILGLIVFIRDALLFFTNPFQAFSPVDYFVGGLFLTVVTAALWLVWYSIHQLPQIWKTETYSVFRKLITIVGLYTATIMLPATILLFSVGMIINLQKNPNDLSPLRHSEESYLPAIIPEGWTTVEMPEGRLSFSYPATGWEVLESPEYSLDVGNLDPHGWRIRINADPLLNSLSQYDEEKQINFIMTDINGQNDKGQTVEEVEGIVPGTFTILDSGILDDRRTSAYVLTSQVDQITHWKLYVVRVIITEKDRVAAMVMMTIDPPDASLSEPKEFIETVEFSP